MRISLAGSDLKPVPNNLRNSPENWQETLETGVGFYVLDELSEKKPQANGSWKKNPRRWEGDCIVVTWFLFFVEWSYFPLAKCALHHTQHTHIHTLVHFIQYKCVGLCKQQIKNKYLYTKTVIYFDLISDESCNLQSTRDRKKRLMGLKNSYPWRLLNINSSEELRISLSADSATGWEEKVTNSINCSKGILVFGSWSKFCSCIKSFCHPCFFGCNLVEKSL